MTRLKQLVLASTSPFRRDLLASTGLAFATASSQVDESKITAANARDLAVNRARAKALAVAAGLPEGAVVIGADQVLGFEDRALDKVASRDEARRRLQMLAGQTHFLHSAYAIVVTGGAASPDPTVLVERLVDISMVMRSLEKEEIEAYLDLGEWRGSVGCYQFENRGIHLFTHVGGSQSAIVGLSLTELLADLRELGINGLLQPEPPWTMQSRSSQRDQAGAKV